MEGGPARWQFVDEPVRLPRGQILFEVIHAGRCRVGSTARLPLGRHRPPLAVEESVPVAGAEDSALEGAPSGDLPADGSVPAAPTEPKQPTGKHEDSKQPTGKHEDSKQSEVKPSESKQSSGKQSESKQSESKQA